MFKKNFAALLILFSAIFIFAGAARAQETEEAATSNLTGIALPAGASRVLPGSVPAEINQAFDKISAAGAGKVEKGETEVLVWGGANYKKTNAAGIISRLTTTLKSAGWQYSVEGEEGGMTVFSAFKEGNPRRAVVGFHGATDDALIFSWMELLPAGAANNSLNQTENNPATENVQQSAPVRNSTGGSIVGTWSNGYMSLLSGYTPTTGPQTYTPGRASSFLYKFYANGTFEFTGLMKMTQYNCTTSYFQDKRGRYTINGNQITLSLTKNFWRQQDNCVASNNREVNHKLDPEIYTLTIKRNEYGNELVCLNSGEGDACYKREEK